MDGLQTQHCQFGKDSKKITGKLIPSSSTSRTPSSAPRGMMRHVTIWQARLDAAYRFYFAIERDTYRILSIIPYPK